jgi:glucose/arabinose dehydrogenase
VKRLVVALVAVLALAGCGGDDDEARPAPDSPTPAQKEVPGRDAPRGDFFALEEVADGFDRPLGMVAEPGSGDLYVLEQGGRVVGLENDSVLVDLSDSVQAGGEQGLLGLAFHPDYPDDDRVFVHYTNADGNTRVDEYRAPGGSVDRDTRRELLALEDPYPNHNGGQLSFGPDGLLYLGMGDGGSAFDPEDRAQDLETRFGKLLRIDADDPDADWEVAAYGLRNPWRFSWDRETGSLWIADVGQDEREEIDAVAELPDPPLNFGWPAFEGSHDVDEREPEGPGDLVGPVAEYDHDQGCSVSGGYVYRGEAVERMRGRYVYGDLCTGYLWTLQAGKDSASDVRREDDTVEQVAAFGEDAAGELYVIALDGRVLRVTDS